MRLKFCVVLLTLTALAWAVENTQAGVVRYAAKKMQKPEHVAASAVGTAGAGVKTAGQTTSGALGRGWNATKTAAGTTAGAVGRSEERRVGKRWRWRRTAAADRTDSRRH